MFLHLAEENEVEENKCIFDIYKYLRLKDRNKVFTYPQSISRAINKSTLHVLHDGGEDKKELKTQQKAYAILQENRLEISDHKLRKFLLIYSNYVWKILTIASLFISYILNTCVYTFFLPRERPFWIIIVVIGLESIFIMDVIIVFGLKLSKKWRKTLNLVEPETWQVVLDIILAVPYAFLYLLNVDNATFDFHAISPVIAILRVYRILVYFYNISSQAGSNQWTTFLGQYLMLFVLSVHTWTCIWYLFSYRKFDLRKIRQSWSVSTVYLPTETTSDWYFVCAYWSVMFLTTNALGDLYPVTTIERIVATLAILLGFFLTTIVFVGSLTSQFITITTRRSKYARQLNKIKNHLSLINMDEDTTKRIIR